VSEGLGDVLHRVVKLQPKDIHRLASAEDRERRASLRAMNRDEQLIAGAKKYYNRDILIPSYAHWYEEAKCPTCRDDGWVSHLVEVGHPNFGHLFPCLDCQGPRMQAQRLRRTRQRSLSPHRMGCRGSALPGQRGAVRLIWRGQQRMTCSSMDGRCGTARL